MKFHSIQKFCPLASILFFLCLNTTTFAQNDDGDVLKRERWFMMQRVFPFDTLSNPAYLLAMQQYNIIRNGGYFVTSTSWQSIGPRPLLGEYREMGGRTQAVLIHPNDPNTLFLGAADGGVWKSTDGGANWTAKTDLENTLSSGALAYAPSNPNIMYWGTGEGAFTYAFYGRGIYKSTDGGEHWVQHTNGLPNYTYVSRIAVHPTNPDIVFAALGTNAVYYTMTEQGGLYKSTDGGVTWVRKVPDPSFTRGLVASDVKISPPPNDNVVLVGGGHDWNSPNPWDNGTDYRRSTDYGET